MPTSGYGRDSHNTRRRRDTNRPPQMRPFVVEPATEYEVWDLTAGVRADKTPKEIPPNATPFCEGVRFEGSSLRPEFGLSAIGDASGYKVLGLSDHKYIRDVDGTPKLFQRIMRIVRTDEGYAQVESLNDGIWTVASTSTLPLEDTYLSVVSTQNYLLFADGKRIYKWIEPSPTVTLIQSGFYPSENLLENPGEATVPLDIDPLTDHPAYNDLYTFRYHGQINISTALDPKGLNGDTVYTITLAVKIWGENANGTWRSITNVHTYSNPFFEIGEGSSDSSSFTFDAEVNLAGAKRFKLEYESIEIESEGGDRNLLYITDYSAWVHGLNHLIDADYGIEYERYDAIGGQIDLLSDYAPAASHIFPFGDRLLALQGEGNPQLFSASVDARVDLWFDDPLVIDNIDTVKASLLDSVGDPLDDLMAMGFVAGNRAALIRKRTIMQVLETGVPAFPIAAQHWVEGIGTESPHSVAQARDGIVFLGHNLMVYYFDGTGPPTAIGVPIHEILRRSLTSNQDLVDGAYDPIYDEYIMGVPEEGASYITRLWICSLGTALDEGELKWRSRVQNVERLATVSRL